MRWKEIIESASAGATGVASVATVATALGGVQSRMGIGVGFDPNGDHGIYSKKPKSKIKEDEGDENEYFSSDAIATARKQNDKSRDKLIYMSPEDFLKVAMSGKDANKAQRVEAHLNAGGKFSDIPFLGFVHDGEGTAKVTSHEGRHRARALLARGVKSMPVLLSHRYDANGQSIRWGSVNDKNGYDYFKDEWPNVLYGQSGDSEETNKNRWNKIPFPVKREMIGEKENLKELFTKKSYEWKEYNPKNVCVATFEVNDIPYSVLISNLKDKTYYFEFSAHIKGYPPQRITGLANNSSVKVFSNVIQIIYEFLRKEKPSCVEFSGNLENGKAKLYSAMATHLKSKIEKLGYTIKIKDDIDRYIFNIVSKSDDI